MRKKQKQAILLAAMITLALQTGTTYAKEIDPGIYKDYIEFGTEEGSEQGKATISLDKTATEDKTYTFENGTLIDGSENTGRGYDATINNGSNKNLTINVGNESVHSDFTIKNSNSTGRGGYVSGIYSYNTGGILINATNTDIIVSKGGGSLYATGDSNITIDGKNSNTNLTVISDDKVNWTEGRIVLRGNSSINIDNVNNINIIASDDEYSPDELGGYTISIEGNSKLLINANNFAIGNGSNDRLLSVSGFYIQDKGSSDLNIKNSFSIESTQMGMIIERNSNAQVLADNIYIKTKYQTSSDMNNSLAQKGTAIFSDGKINLIANKNIILSGDTNGLVISGNKNVDNSIASIGSEIIIQGDKQYGIYRSINENNASIKAKKNINVFGGLAGVKITGDKKNKQTEIVSQEGNITITSDKNGLEVKNGVFKDTLGTQVNIIADKNLTIQGNIYGVYNEYSSGNLTFNSKKENIFILGNEAAIYSSNISNSTGTSYKVKGTVFNINSDRGNIYIGGINNNNELKNNQSISITDRNSVLNINSNNIVQIEGKNSALELKKEVNGNIKGNILNLFSEGTSVNIEGANNLNIGDNNTQLMQINGDIGIEQTANSIGKDDYDFDPEKTPTRTDNKINLTADIINIEGKSYGIKLSQEATAKEHTQQYILSDWRNNSFNITADENLWVEAKNGNGIDVQGINKVNINNKGQNFIKGNDIGININLNKLDFDLNNFETEINNYKSNTMENYLKKLIGEKKWNTSYKTNFEQSVASTVRSMFGYNTTEQFYSDMLSGFNQNKDMQEIVDSIGEEKFNDFINNLNSQDGVVINTYKFIGFIQGVNVSDADINNLKEQFKLSYGEYYIETTLKNNQLETIQDLYDLYYDKYHTTGVLDNYGFINIADNIDATNDFNLITSDNGTNYVLGGNEALKVDGELNAHIKGGSNVISNDIGIAAKSDTPKYAVHGENGAQVDIEATNGDNIIQSTDIGVYAVGDSTDVNIKNTSNSSVESAQTLITAVNEGIIAKDLADININGDNSDVNILSGSKGIWATGNGANVNIAGKGVNITATGNNDEKIAVVAGLEDTSASSAVHSVVNINTTGNSTSTIFGDIIGARNGIVNINSNNSKAVHQGNLFIKGDILAGNGGSVDVNLGNGGYFEGRADDYQDAAEKTGKSFFDPHFTNGTVETEGTLNLTLGSNATWKVTGQSWVTQVNSDNGFIDLCSANTDRNEIGKALTIRTLEGNANFKMSLDGNRSASDMLYIKDGNGTYNVILDDAVSKDEIGLTGLRFATSDDKYSNVKFDKVVALDKGVFNVRYAVDTDDYQGNKENDIYNNGKGTAGNEMNEYKPGTDSVDEFLQEDLNKQHEAQIQTLSLKEKSAAEIDATNHKIIDIAEQTISDAGKTILNMAQANYSNAIYLDTLNKRMGEARYIDGNDGIWVRMGHYSLGKENKFESDHNLYQLGYDKLYETENGQRRIGAAIDYMSGNAAYKNTFGSGDLDRKGITLYDTWTGNKGHYTDYVFRWGHRL